MAGYYGVLATVTSLQYFTLKEVKMDRTIIGRLLHDQYVISAARGVSIKTKQNTNK